MLAHEKDHATAGEPCNAYEFIQGHKYRWKIKTVEPALVRSLAYTHSLSLPIAHTLVTRGMIDDASIRSFLLSSYEHNVPHAGLLHDSTTAVTRIIRAIKNREKILIFGDYDVDGITAVSLTLTALIPLDARINFFLPNREKDGYGLSASAVEQAFKNGYSLIITVDNGITAFQAAQTAQKRGIDLIITDHHRPHETLPPAIAIIDPHRTECSYPFKELAGVGVVFKLISLIYEQLGIKRLPEKVYELLMLGTIADVVPLIGENRFWVRHGLNLINQNKSNAISVLATNASLSKETFDSLDIGFFMAPQVNALGRLSDPRDAVKFMISSDMDEVERIGAILKTMNEERKRVEQGIYKEIELAIGHRQIDLDQEYLITACSSEWPSGVIGLVAGKLAHNYGRPTFLFHIDSNKDIAKGSCRSIPEFNIFDALTTCSDLLIQFGGHACAAGLKLKHSNLPALKERLSTAIASQFTLQDLRPGLTLDAPLILPEASLKCVSDLEQMEPFGNQNPQPLFLIKNVTLLKQPQVLKEKHVKCMIFADGIVKPVIFFNRPDIYEPLQNLGDKPFHLAAHIIKNEWGGSTRIELQGMDVAFL